MKRFLVFLLCLSMASVTLSLGKLSLIRTQYVDIMYEPSQIRHAVILSESADRIYEELINISGLKAVKRVRVYIVDNVAFANGYANPVNNVIVIYPNDIDPSDFSPNYENWVTFCFAHELAHIFLSNSFAPYVQPLSAFGHAVAAAVQSSMIPAYLQEGFAIYAETKVTGSGRGVDSKFKSYQEAAKLTPVGLRYAASPVSSYYLPGGASYVQGFSFLNYFEQKYGTNELMSSIRAFLSNPAAGFFRFVKGKIHEWNKVIPDLPRDKDEISSIQLNATCIDSNAWRVYYHSVDYNGEEAIWYYDTISNENVRVVNVDNLISFSVSRTGIIAISRYVPTPHSGNDSECFLFSGSTKKLNIDKVLKLCWKNDFEIVMLKQEEDGTRHIGIYDLRNRQFRKLIQGSDSFVPLEITSDGIRIFFTAKVKGQVDIYLLDWDNSLYRLTNDKYVEIAPKARDNFLYFCADYEGVFQPFELRLDNLSIFKLHETPLGAYSVLCMEDYIYICTLVPGGYTLERARIHAEDLRRKADKIPYPYAQDEDVHVLSQEKTDFVDSPSLRFIVPFPYVTLTEDYSVDWGIGVSSGVWDDLMDLYLGGYLVWSWNTWQVQLIGGARKGLSLATHYSQMNKTVNFDVDLQFPIYLNSFLRDDMVALLWHLEAGNQVSSSAVTGVKYCFGKNGGIIHNKQFCDFAMWAMFTPDINLGTAKSFLLGDYLVNISGEIRPRLASYSLDVLFPEIPVNCAAEDGWLGLDSLNFGAHFRCSSSSDLQLSYDLNLEGKVFLHVFYQVPVPISLVLGVKNNEPYFRFFVNNVMDFISF